MSFFRDTVLAASATLIAAVIASPAIGAPPDRGEPLRGVVVTCFRWGPGEWDRPIMRQTLADVAGVGATAVQVHPYARIGDDGSLGWAATPDETVLRPVAWARDRGLAMMVKPHIAYWRSRFGWRGEITFGDDAAAWDRFFADYERFIFRMAELAERGGAAWFVVGTELEGTIHFEARWRAIIAGVRQRFSGKLTYAANWDRYREVPFWDALDAVGVQGYFPVVAPPAAGGPGGPLPGLREVRLGWERIAAELAAYREAVDRPIMLAELGYAATASAAAQPWLAGPVSGAGLELQQRLMRAALTAIEAEPAIEGVFLWKWFPTRREMRHDFALQHPAMTDLLREAWPDRRAEGVRPSATSDTASN